MGIPKKWSRITSWHLENIPEEAGAYEIADRFKRTIDIGGSGNLAARLPRKVSDQKFGDKPSTSDTKKHITLGL